MNALNQKVIVKRQRQRSSLLITVQRLAKLNPKEVDPEFFLLGTTKLSPIIILPTVLGTGALPKIPRLTCLVYFFCN